MTIDVGGFDLSEYDSAVIDGYAPQMLCERLELTLDEMHIVRPEKVFSSELATRALLDILISENLRVNNGPQVADVVLRLIARAENGSSCFEHFQLSSGIQLVLWSNFLI